MAASERLSVCFGAFELNEENARLSRDGQAVSLPPKAFAVLCELARHPGQLVTKHVLLDAVWGHQHVSDSVLKTVISELRQALDDDARQPRYIETAARRGYRFIAALTTQRVSRIAQRSSSTRTSLTHTRSVAMVGREAALRRLCEAWNDAADGQRRIVWVAGEAGIGNACLYSPSWEQH